MKSKPLQGMIIRLFLLMLLVGLLTTCQKNPTTSTSVLHIAVAASASDAIRALAASFYLETGIKVEIIHASSGKLAAQITQSAPYGLFFSADEYYPDFLVKQGFSASEPFVYAQGVLSIWVREIKRWKNTPVSDILTDQRIQKIAIANTTTAPYGKAAYEWIKAKGILKDIEHKLVFGESVAQVNTYLMGNTVDIAFTIRSSLQQVNKQVRDHLIALPAKEHTPIRQAMIITNFGQEYFPEESLSFFNFVRSKKGQAILLNYGYSCP